MLWLMIFVFKVFSLGFGVCELCHPQSVSFTGKPRTIIKQLRKKIMCEVVPFSIKFIFAK